MNAQTQRTWLQRNTKWIVLTAVLLGLLMLVGFVGGILAIVSASMQSSDVFKTSMQRAQASPAVIAALGEPVEPGFFVSGSISVENRTGEADLSIPVSGPRGEATIDVVAHKRDGAWNYEIMRISGEKLPPVDLLQSPQ